MSEIVESNGMSIASSAVFTEAIQRAVREAVLTHAKLGRSVPISRDGKVVWITPEEIFAMFPDDAASGDKL